MASRGAEKSRQKKQHEQRNKVKKQLGAFGNQKHFRVTGAEMEGGANVTARRYREPIEVPDVERAR